MREWYEVGSEKLLCIDLYLSDNGLSGQVSKQLQELHHLQSLDLSENTTALSVDVSTLTILTALQKVCMWGSRTEGSPVIPSSRCRTREHYASSSRQQRAAALGMAVTATSGAHRLK